MKSFFTRKQQQALRLSEIEIGEAKGYNPETRGYDRDVFLVREVNEYNYNRPEGATHCVECRATNAIAFYGTRAECVARCAILNSGKLAGVAR